MRTILSICSFLCVAVSGTPAVGQHLAANQPLAAISYRAVGKLIYVPVQVNGSSPRWFIFDTGAPNSLIDGALAKSLHVGSISSEVIHGAGKGDVSAHDAGEVKLTLGGLSPRVPHAKIVDLSNVPLPAKGYGLVGAEFLEQYVICIDPIAHTMTFYDPKTYTYQGHGKPVPLELTNSRLYIQAGLAAKPGELVQRRLRVDTGSEDSIDDDTVRRSPDTKKTTLGNGARQELRGSFRRLCHGGDRPIQISTCVGASRGGRDHWNGDDAPLYSDLRRDAWPALFGTKLIFWRASSGTELKRSSDLSPEIGL